MADLSEFGSDGEEGSSFDITPRKAMMGKDAALARAFEAVRGAKGGEVGKMAFAAGKKADEEDEEDEEDKEICEEGGVDRMVPPQGTLVWRQKAGDYSKSTMKPLTPGRSGKGAGTEKEGGLVRDLHMEPVSGLEATIARAQKYMDARSERTTGSKHMKTTFKPLTPNLSGKGKGTEKPSVASTGAGLEFGEASKPLGVGDGSDAMPPGARDGGYEHIKTTLQPLSANRIASTQGTNSQTEKAQSSEHMKTTVQPLGPAWSQSNTTTQEASATLPGYLGNNERENGSTPHNVGFDPGAVDVNRCWENSPPLCPTLDARVEEYSQLERNGNELPKGYKMAPYQFWPHYSQPMCTGSEHMKTTLPLRPKRDASTSEEVQNGKKAGNSRNEMEDDPFGRETVWNTFYPGYTLGTPYPPMLYKDGMQRKTSSKPLGPDRDASTSREVRNGKKASNPRNGMEDDPFEIAMVRKAMYPDYIPGTPYPPTLCKDGVQMKTTSKPPRLDRDVSTSDEIRKLETFGGSWNEMDKKLRGRNTAFTPLRNACFLSRPNPQTVSKDSEDTKRSAKPPNPTVESSVDSQDQKEGPMLRDHHRKRSVPDQHAPIPAAKEANVTANAQTKEASPSPTIDTNTAKPSSLTDYERFQPLATRFPEITRWTMYAINAAGVSVGFSFLFKPKFGFGRIGLPWGLSLRWLFGTGMVVGGAFNIVTSFVESIVAVDKGTKPPGGFVRLARWGFAGVGMVMVGIKTWTSGASFMDGPRR